MIQVATLVHLVGTSFCVLLVCHRINDEEIGLFVVGIVHRTVKQTRAELLNDIYHRNLNNPSIIETEIGKFICWNIIYFRFFPSRQKLLLDKNS